MHEQEAIIFIKNAMEQSRNALAELMLSAPKVFKRRTELLGEYYSNLENCKKEIQSCEVAIKALEEIQQYRAIGTVNEFKSLKEDWLNKFDRLIEYRKIGTVEECRAAVDVKKKITEIVNRQLIAGKNNYKETNDCFYEIVKVIQDNY